MNLSEWMLQYSDPIFEVETAEKSIKHFCEKILAPNGHACRILLYGAGIVGRRFVSLLRELGNNELTVVDRNFDTVAAIPGVNIVSPDAVDWTGLSETDLVIASMNRNYFAELQASLKERGYRYAVYEGQTLYASLRSAKCTLDVERDNRLHDDVECHDCVIMDNVCVPRRDSFIKKYGSDKINPAGSDKMWMIGYILGQYCTLKCKHCCEAIPYYKASQREFVKADIVIKDITYMAAACQFLTTVEFIGGEPFLHPELFTILSEVIKLPNIGKVHIFSNGTVIPSDELCSLLSNERFEVTISNYQITLNDALRERVSKTTQKLQDAKCNVLIGKRQGWMDFASFDLVCDDEEKVKERYRNCFIHTCNRLYKGVLYHCPHEYAGALQGHFDSHKDILHIYDYTTEELSKKLNEYKEREFFESCKYCKLPYDAEPVVSGIQLEEE